MENMLKFKTGVNIDDVHQKTYSAMMICCIIYSFYNLDCVVTSVKDGKHMAGSKHYIGKAFDLRIRQMTVYYRAQIFKKLKIALGKNYTVLLEKDHFHIQYDF